MMNTEAYGQCSAELQSQIQTHLSSKGLCILGEEPAGRIAVVVEEEKRKKKAKKKRVGMRES